MTFDDDYLQLDFGDGIVRRAGCQVNNIDWPPPVELDVFGFKFIRTNYSKITDEERAGMSHVCRGAAYTVSHTLTCSTCGKSFEGCSGDDTCRDCWNSFEGMTIEEITQ